MTDTKDESLFIAPIRGVIEGSGEWLIKHESSLVASMDEVQRAQAQGACTLWELCDAILKARDAAQEKGQP